MRAIPTVPPEFTYLIARDPAFRAHAIRSMTGTSGRQGARTEALTPYPLPTPPTKISMEFKALASGIFAKIEANHKTSRALAAQQDSLLTKLISGSVWVDYRSGLPPTIDP